MTIDDAINMLAWTRTRLTRILESLPDSFLQFKPDCKFPESYQYKKPYSILSHIAGAEIYWIHEKVRKSPLDNKHKAFRDKDIPHIISELGFIRTQTTNWLNTLDTGNLDAPYSNRAKTNISWIVYHVAEHEAHHLAQIDMLASFAGIKTPWV